MIKNVMLVSILAVVPITLTTHVYQGISNLMTDKPATQTVAHFPTPIAEFPIPLIEDALVELDPVEFECMRTNMFFEARNQRTDAAFTAVGFTVLNRVDHKRYPDTICGVVQQARRDSKGNTIRNKCQFSWFCDGKPDEPNLNNIVERRAWERAGELAAAVMRNEVDNPIGRATMYHATYVSPYWRTAYTRVAQVESHIFYS